MSIVFGLETQQRVETELPENEASIKGAIEYKDLPDLISRLQLENRNLPDKEVKSFPENVCKVCLFGLDEDPENPTSDEDQLLDLSRQVQEVSLPLMEGPCGHYYHSSCIIKWTQNHTSCPECRQPLILQGVDPGHLLREATERGDSGAVGDLLSLNQLSRDEMGRALISASEKGYSDVIEILLKQGSIPRCFISQALFRCARVNQVRSVKVLLQSDCVSFETKCLALLETELRRAQDVACVFYAHGISRSKAFAYASVFSLAFFAPWVPYVGTYLTYVFASYNFLTCAKTALDLYRTK